MNCTNCGAPFDALSHGGVLCCDYCRSHRVISDDGRGLDRVVFLGSPTDLDCPSCGDQLVTAIVDDNACRACPTCFGVAIQQPSFGMLVARRRADFQGADRTPAPLHHADLEHHCECPICRDVMDVHPYYGPGNTIIDSCRNCGLVWLDAGELTAIETAPGLR